MELLDKVKAEVVRHDATLLYLAKSGSKLFGTDTPESDEDYMGLFLPSKNSLLLGRSPKHLTMNVKNSSGAKNEQGDVDCTLYSLHNFFNLLEKADSNMVSLLFSDSNEDAVLYTELPTDLDKSKLISKRLAGMVGYTKSQMYKYSLKGTRYKIANEVLSMLKKLAHKEQLGDKLLLERIVADVQLDFEDDISAYLSVYDEVRDTTTVSYLVVLNKMLNGREKVSKHVEVLQNMVNIYGHRAKNNLDKPDYKAMYHALRVGDEVVELHVHGNLVYPSDHAITYKKIRKGAYSLDEVSEFLENNLQTITAYEEGVLTSKLADKVDRKYMDSVLLSMYS